MSPKLGVCEGETKVRSQYKHRNRRTERSVGFSSDIRCWKLQTENRDGTGRVKLCTARLEDFSQERVACRGRWTRISTPTPVSFACPHGGPVGIVLVNSLCTDRKKVLCCSISLPKMSSQYWAAPKVCRLYCTTLGLPVFASESPPPLTYILWNFFSDSHGEYTRP